MKSRKSALIFLAIASICIVGIGVYITTTFGDSGINRENSYDTSESETQYVETGDFSQNIEASESVGKSGNGDVGPKEIIPNGQEIYTTTVTRVTTQEAFESEDTQIIESDNASTQTAAPDTTPIYNNQPQNFDEQPLNWNTQMIQPDGVNTQAVSGIH